MTELAKEHRQLTAHILKEKKYDIWKAENVEIVVKRVDKASFLQPHKHEETLRPVIDYQGIVISHNRK